MTAFIDEKMKKNCKIFTLYSGSGGNAVFVKVGGTSVLIDAGKSARTLCRALTDIGECIDNISAIFITHEHGDHISALETLSKKNEIPIHIRSLSAEKFDSLPPDAPIHSRLCRHTDDICEQVGEIKLSSFRTPHDSRMSVGYRIEFEDEDGTHTVGIATDIGFASPEVKKGLLGCEAVILEANHDINMLMTGPYPRELKRRVASNRGHLSNEASAELAAFLAENGTKSFLLAHLSLENNEPQLALDTVQSALSGFDAYVCTAHPCEPTELVLKGGKCNAECEAYNPWNA